MLDPSLPPIKSIRIPSDPRFRNVLQPALADAAREWIGQRRQRVDGFCGRHFSLQGAWRIHRRALGHDLWRAPANALWAAPYLLVQGVGTLAGKLGWQKSRRWLVRLPPGFHTAVAQEVEWLLYTELLELPIDQGSRVSSRDSLLETLMAQDGITGMLLPELLNLDELGGQSQARAKLERFFTTYSGSRTAAADMAGSLLNLAAGAAAFHQFTPGSLALGTAAATALAQQLAIANFALGSTLGSLYYGLFPVAASTSLVVASISGIMAALGLFTAFSGVLTDPVQQALGFHRRRLHRLLDALENQLLENGGDFKLHDAYLARAADMIDLIRGAVQALR